MRVKGLYIFIIVLICVCSGCNSEVENKKKVEEVKVKYHELSNISPLYHNKTMKYTDKDIKTDLYSWSEDVILPVPMPEGAEPLGIVDHFYRVLNVDKEVWDNYVKSLEDKYKTTYYNSDCDGEEIFSIYDSEKNYYVKLTWREYDGFNNMKNSLEVYVYVGCQFGTSSLSNKEVLDKAVAFGEIENSKDFSIINVSSANNIEDGFNVYYISTSKKHYDKTGNHMYLCVVKDDDVIFLESNKVMIGGCNDIEFLEQNGNWKMFILHTENSVDLSMTDCCTDWQILEYEFLNGRFEQITEENEYVDNRHGYAKNASFSKDKDKIYVCRLNHKYKYEKNKESEYDGAIPFFDKFYEDDYIGVIRYNRESVIDIGGPEKTEEETGDIGRQFEYKEISDISMLTPNRLWKYDDEYTGCQQYEWGKGVVMPVPKFAGGEIEYIYQDYLWVKNVSLEEFAKYPSLFDNDYYVDTDYDKKFDRYDICINHKEKNYTVNMTWYSEYMEEKNIVSVHIYMGCQEKMPLTNEKVLEMAKKELEYVDEDFSIKNISSHSNINDGFYTYLIVTSKEHAKHTGKGNYLCVVRDGKIVALIGNAVLIIDNDEIMFLEKNNKWYMYVLSMDFELELTLSGGSGFSYVTEYILENERFTLNDRISEFAVKSNGAYPMITMEKDGDRIDIYSVKKYYYVGETLDSIPSEYDKYEIEMKIGCIK